MSDRAVCPSCGEEPDEAAWAADTIINSVGDDWEIMGQFECPNCYADLSFNTSAPPEAVERTDSVQ